MQVQPNKNKKIGIDRHINGDLKDIRKGNLFLTKKEDLSKKTKLTGFRKTIFKDRYSLKDKDGKPMEEYPEQMWERVAKGISQFEKNAKDKRHWEKEFYSAMEGFKFVPAGRILSGAGTGYEVTFYNCYVIPSPSDSRGGIMESITHTVEIQARGGGVGLNLSSLRPRGARVRKVNGTSSGPVNWASLYSTANHEVIQQGGSRRGALMLMLHDWHPDIEEFIQVKEDLTKIPGANLSVCVSDKFMNALKKDADWDLKFADIDDPEYDEKWNGDIYDWIALGKKTITYKTVKARDIWEKISHAAWRSAEPGLHFLERSNKTSNTWYFEKLVATNPCGEQPLGAWSVCNLGAMNLVAYVKNREFDFEGLGRDVKVAVRFLDNVVDGNFYFYEENKKEQENIRRTGLGTLGLGDALIKMKIRYGSKASLDVIEKIYKTIRDNAYSSSSSLAKEKGSFGAFDKKKYLKGQFIKRLPKNVKEKIAKQGIRNAVILTQAPTGTTSLLSGVSSGIEPNYDFEFKRTDRTGEHIIYHHLYKKWKEDNSGKKVPSYFVSAKDLSPEDHVRVQAKIQSFTDSSISKTVNAPENYSVEDVDKLYRMAYDLGCKGITFFRDGSRKGVLESTNEKNVEDVEVLGKDGGVNGQTMKVQNWERPMKVSGETYKIKTPVGTAFITINSDEMDNPIEVFINIGRAGSDVQAMAEALGRVISKSLKFSGHLDAKERSAIFIDQLRGIGGRRSVGFGPNKILSLPDAVAMALSDYLNIKVNGNGKNASKLAEAGGDAKNGKSDYVAGTKNTVQEVGDLCPECGSSSFIYQEGCAKCHACGHSEC